MRKIIPCLLLVALVFCGNANAQKKNKPAAPAQLASASVDSAADAAAIARMRHKMDSIRKYRPTVALVLAGGGAKGAAHIGALEYIEELGIPIDMVLGTSMGGLVGGLVAMGYDAKTIDTILTTTNWGVMLSDKVPINKMAYSRRRYNDTYPIRIPFHYEDEEWERRAREALGTRIANEQTMQGGSSEMAQQYQANMIANLPDGYLYGYNVNNIINSLTVGYQDSMDFCDLPIPYCCVATDLVEMKAKYWTSGRLSEAMRSTMSIPFYFMPVRTGGRILVDGGTRNNFPTDMARAMGADFVIGVDLSQPRKYTDINGLTPLLMQCINLMGKDAFDNNKALADVYIHPDMSGMNMMSFDSESIAECLHRGYVAATEQQDKLQQIRQRTGSHPVRKLNAPQALNIGKQKILIGSLQYENLGPDFALHFSKMAGIHTNERYDRQDIENEMALMYGTGFFDQLSYSILGNTEPYTLLFHCKRGPIHQFGFALHFDSKTMLSAAFNLGINKRKLSGFMVDFSAVIGNNPSATLDLGYSFLKGPSVGLSLHTRYQTLDQYSAQQSIINNFIHSITMWYNRVDLYLITHSWRDGSIKAGVEYSVTPYTNKTSFFLYDYSPTDTTSEVSEKSISKNTKSTITNWDGYRSTYSNQWDNYAISPYIEAIYNNTDDSYFPTKGVDIGLRYDYIIFHESPDYSFVKYQFSNNINSHIKGVIPLSNRIDLIPSLWVNANISHFTYDDVSDETPEWLECSIGGTTAGRFYQNQLPYIGYNTPHFLLYSPINAVCNFDFRLQLNSKVYLTFTTAGYSTIAFDLDKESSKEYRINDLTDYAFALQLGYKSIIGPINFNVHWSRYNEPSPWGVYLSAGFEF